MKGWLYDKDTKEYITEIELNIDREESRVQGKEIYLVPAFCTLKEISIISENQIQVFNIENDCWDMKVDYRGEKYYSIDENGYYISEETIKESGVDINDKITIKPQDLLKPKWNKNINIWEEGEDIIVVKNIKINQVKDFMKNKIQEQWSILDQINILNGLCCHTIEEKQEMIDFINEINITKNETIDTIKSMNNIENIKNFQIVL